MTFQEALEHCSICDLFRKDVSDNYKFEVIDKIMSSRGTVVPKAKLCNIITWLLKKIEYQRWHYIKNGDFPKCDEDKKLWLFFKDYHVNDKDFLNPIYRTAPGVYKTSFLNENVKLFAEKSKVYESEILPKDVIAWQYLPEPLEEIK